jgi:hypothetical protein
VGRSVRTLPGCPRGNDSWLRRARAGSRSGCLS